MILDSY